MTVQNIRFDPNRDELVILDQTLLPHEERYVTIATLEQAEHAIETLQVRGAPAIAYFGAFVLAKEAVRLQDDPDFTRRLDLVGRRLIATRPTAVNLQNVIESLLGFNVGDDFERIATDIKHRAIALFERDVDTYRAIGEHALTVLPAGGNVLTICNAGAIATSRYGTALAPFYVGKERGIAFNVFACETRPLLQGARLTVWELDRADIDVTLITDNMAAWTIQAKGVDAIIVGADRITRTGHVANKIGTLQLAVLAKHYGIPFYVAAPHSTFDLTADDVIQIEERSALEVTHIGGQPTAPVGITVFNPAFDVTPPELITGLITEAGVFEPTETDITHHVGGTIHV
ncbi:S-methyl-5-thioribose-1-phosphate isomerase [Exiguobacterium sp. SH3S2]|uniref:S-methyl-5-thioribose-1-phosphate isomerase n=1 Tax=unclassified Exiguobacterium TaxID=2644629 RepID=UPI00103FA0E8|nr:MULTISPECIES: S-methyl-5-thioribose-1-phosphate isomerase [unclassified Exiguobacterium]TCI24494.1 S-methyl-5-thioribose-1-phosphate isomerase [Exiguobacterium sp. SH5S4]TCI44870.1 S-methyl-5-thioribose-1-phosphate isomerase [Exiguobacterium sp. SH3S3]TCI51382.1 S-methyl-5-thioribose-1-phosphate isomerase [Exiguobacterium sp. SH5S13]TCI60291.1 S-methyl-5-thioribose-1-phosphate isomerase [Exiguobacterium sp. SH3S2]TCI64246.1 S-methyl-5-thioribose-1-phosphate isomerase [Exiguobacterium sp. SH